MFLSFGMLCAIIALLAWTFGDFSIQRATRQVGAIPALCAIGLLGFLVLTPLVWSDIPALFSNRFTLWILAATLLITLTAALLDFEALRVGKLAVIEPVMSLELPITVLVGLLFLQERMSMFQTLLILGVFIGITLTALRHERVRWWQHWQQRSRLEQGVWLAGIGAIAMALTNVLTGVSSQLSSPLAAIWFIHTGLAAFCLLVMTAHRQLTTVAIRVKKHWRPVLAASVFDNTAWIAYATAATVLPISITIGITESYIALASLLGLWLNKERLQRHQLAGVGLALVSAILLALISE